MAKSVPFEYPDLMLSFKFFGRYGVVGISAAVTDFLVLAVLTELKLWPVLAKGLSYLLSALVAYILHRQWSFRSGAPVMRSALQFALVNFISLTANVATFAWVFMLSRSISLGAILAFLLGAIINFVGYRFIFTGKSRHE